MSLSKAITILQISSEVNIGSVGRIAENIGDCILTQGWKSIIAYGRAYRTSTSRTFKIGTKFDIILHGVLTRFTDKHGFGSRRATSDLIWKIKSIKPDLIHLQHLHGYYINIEVLFDYLFKSKIPVVWTFHDCWSFTGHCAHYEFVRCNKWEVHCEKCPQTKEYPKSLFMDNSYNNFEAKKRLFTSINNLTIVPVSNWLGGEVQKSFLKNHSIRVIQNGVDLKKFKIIHNNLIKQRYRIEDKFLILGVAHPWTERKGFKYFLELYKLLDDRFRILLVGLDTSQIKRLPREIIGIRKTESIEELASLYSAADVFVNPTLEDTFPTTNIEALACGTPVVTFKSGGAPESIDINTGIVVDREDLEGLCAAVKVIEENGKKTYQDACRNRAEYHFDKNERFEEYIALYKELIIRKN